MKFTIEKNIFTKITGQLNRLIISRPPSPILGTIKITLKDNQLTMIATDLERAILAHYPVRIEEEGECCVLGKTLNDLLNSINNDKLKISLQGNDLQIFSSNLETHLSIMSADDFPRIPEIKTSKELTITSKDLKKALDKTLFTVSYDIARPILSGILFNIDKDQVILAGTDAFRLSEYKINNVQKIEFDNSFVLPISTANEVYKILNSSEVDKVTIKVGSDQVEFVIDEFTVVSKLIIGKYPDYQKIIPNENQQRVVIGKEEILSSLRTAEVFSKNNSNVVNLEFGDSGLSIKSQASGVGSYETRIECDQLDKNYSINVNIRYLIEGISSISSDDIAFFIQSETSPFVIKSMETSDNYLHLIMPIN